ncbi:MAG: hypothetical protein ACOYXC_20265, partial [Candidatus Rifleibacteriota bacterium]
LAHGTTYYYRVKARDAVANETSFSAVLSSIQDSNAPSCTSYTDNVALNNDPDQQWSRDVSISFAPVSLADDLSGVSNVYLQIATESMFVVPVQSFWLNNTTGAYTYTAPANDGVRYYAQAFFEDVAGNRSALFKTDGITLDLSDPVAGATDDIAGNTDIDHTVSADSNVYFNFSYSDSVSGIADIRVLIASDSSFSDIAFDAWLGASPLPTSYLFTSGADNSSYTAKIMVKDNAGRVSTWGSQSNGIRIDLSAPADSGGQMFLINKKPLAYLGETSTASPTVFLTLTITDPSGVKSAAVSNDGTNWTIWSYPVLDPASISWSLSPGAGTKTISMYFVDGVDHISAVKTQTIDYFPDFKVQVGDRDDKVYPVDVYDEYQGQNKYGTDRSDSSSPNEGKSLKLQTP